LGKWFLGHASGQTETNRQTHRQADRNISPTYRGDEVISTKQPIITAVGTCVLLTLIDDHVTSSAAAAPIVADAL